MVFLIDLPSVYEKTKNINTSAKIFNNNHDSGHFDVCV